MRHRQHWAHKTQDEEPPPIKKRKKKEKKKKKKNIKTHTYTHTHTKSKKHDTTQKTNVMNSTVPTKHCGEQNMEASQVSILSDISWREQAAIQ